MLQKYVKQGDSWIGNDLAKDLHIALWFNQGLKDNWMGVYNYDAKNPPT